MEHGPAVGVEDVEVQAERGGYYGAGGVAGRDAVQEFFEVDEVAASEGLYEGVVEIGVVPTANDHFSTGQSYSSRSEINKRQ